MTDAKRFKEANLVIKKAIQALNRCHEFAERYANQYPSFNLFKHLMEGEDPEFEDSLKKQ